MKAVFAPAIFLLLSAAVAQNRGEESPNIGAINGLVTAQDGTPAKGLTLNAEPLGVMLLMVLPRTKTNDAGAFRFEHLPLGRYTVFAEDQEAGYSSFSTPPASPGPLQQVELTPDHPAAEFDLHLPPKAGFLQIHLTNRSTGLPVSGVEVTVLSAGNPPRFLFSGEWPSSQPILVPPDKDLLLHVTSSGFLEWDESMGAGKPVRIASGNRLTLDVQLEPSNPLRQRIPDADPKKYQGIHDAKDWRNPYLIIRSDGIEIVGVTDREAPIPIDSVAAGAAGALSGRTRRGPHRSAKCCLRVQLPVARDL